MAITPRATPATEIIAEFLGCDIEEVRDMIYQPTVYRSPRIYSWDDEPWSYFCCPTEKQRPPGTYAWEIAGYSWREAHKGRPVYGVRHRSGR
jgi:hypothetical protein